MTDEITLGNEIIGEKRHPFIIAEMSGNHNGSIQRAFKIIDAAIASGANAIKLQTYTADKITIDRKGGLFDIRDKSSLWNGRNLLSSIKGLILHGNGIRSCIIMRMIKESKFSAVFLMKLE